MPAHVGLRQLGFNINLLFFRLPASHLVTSDESFISVDVILRHRRSASINFDVSNRRLYIISNCNQLTAIGQCNIVYQIPVVLVIKWGSMCSICLSPGQ